MSIYAAVETIVVAIIALLSVYSVLKLLMPAAMHKLGAHIANLLSMTGRGSASTTLASRSPVEAASPGCASGCNGCAMASRTPKVPARDQLIRPR